MTGLDLRADALIEVAALVTDFDLNVLGDGIDLIVKPPAEALEQMGDFVRTMHETSGLLDVLDSGVSLEDAEAQVMAYLREHCTDGSRPPLAGNTVATDRSFLARDMPVLDGFLALPDRRRVIDQGTLPPLVPKGVFPGAGQGRQPSSARGYSGEHRGTALLPRSRLRAEPGPDELCCQGDRPPALRGTDRRDRRRLDCY